MIEDDIVREVRAAREAFAASHGYDIWAMVAALQALAAAGHWTVVRLDPRRPTQTGRPSRARALESANSTPSQGSPPPDTAAESEL